MGSGDTSVPGAAAFPRTTMGFISGLRDAGKDRRAGIEVLVHRYWKPIYLYIRMAWRKSNEDAKDLTQAFLVWLMEGDALSNYLPDRGTFRSYLKLLLTRFLQDEQKALARLKRGGGRAPLHLDSPDARLDELMADPRAVDPQAAFERTLAYEITRTAIDRVRERLVAADRDLHFRAFEMIDLAPAGDETTYAAAAERLSVKESDVRNWLFNVREAVRQEIRVELAKMTTDDADLEEEWRALFGL